MNGLPRCFTMLRSALLAAALAVGAGCATAPGQAVTAPPASGTVAAKTTAATQAPAYAVDETPASETELVQSADFTRKAYLQGFKPEVRNGAVVYCWTDEDIGSRLPTKKCVNRAQAEILIQQRQAQRDALQRMNSGCTPGVNCGS